ncbi:MAG: hypothetical protein A2204_02785 [Elusimicrobia bacterium RIFOXYA1_FULL_47_7]|nr:MAG: hypothetical protein A2204_02785 [Elusimicrobia bacterium RIFOXYA1_FULL_47_7]OGS25600.1 MAG: hypothetical protein A2339_05935 [Elusimicrobia bacterium RIFOXYB12_FULL_50_12]
MGKTKFIAALFVLLIPVIAGAATPKMISFQGKLTDSSNNALNGSYDFIFTIYDNATAGTAQWTETQTGITVTNGLYSVDLGAVNAITSSFDAPYWLDVQVRPTGGGTYEPLSPRHRLTSSPYAFMSDYALNVSSANNYWLQLTSGGATNLHTHASGTPTAHAATHAAGAGDAVTISTSQIVNGSITSTKIANVNASVFNLNLSTFTLGYLSATRVHGGQYFGDGSQLSGIVATVADGSITTAKLAANAVNGEKISPTVIASTHMAGHDNHSVNYDIEVSSSGYAAVSGSARNLASGTYFNDVKVSTAIYADSAGSATVADGSITTAKLAANAVNGEKISPTVIASTHMAGNNNDSIVYDIKVTTAMSVRDEGIVPAKMANSDSHFNLNLTTFTFKHANVLGILNSANANIGLLEGSSGHAKLEVVGTGDHMIINNPAAGANKTLWLIKSTGDYLEFVAPNDGWTTWPAAMKISRDGILTPTYGLIASTITAYNGIIASTVVVTGANENGYSLTLSSGISAPNGRITAEYFTGDGSRLSGTKNIAVWYKVYADTSTDQLVGEQVIFTAPRAITITAIKIEPAGDLSGHPVNYATVAVNRYNSDGTGGVSVATVATSGTSWTKFDVITPGSLSNTSLAAGQKITVAITKDGGGVVVPIMALQVEYTAD